MKRRMQAKHLDDVDVILSILACAKRNQRRLVKDGVADGFYREHLPTVHLWSADPLSQGPDEVRFRREHGPSLRDYYPMVPKKVLVEKLRKLMRRGMVSGCLCGCRADLVVERRGYAYAKVEPEVHVRAEWARMDELRERALEYERVARLWSCATAALRS